MPYVLDKPTGAVPRYGFTIEDVRAMCDAGVLSWDDRFELIDGEVVPMPDIDDPHMMAKRWLLWRLMASVGDAAWVDSEGALFLDERRTFVNPDIYIYPRPMKPRAVRGPDVLLLIEVSGNSLKRDLEDKAALYARHGVEEYWVIEAETLRLWVHRAPSEAGYGAVTEYAPDQTVSPLAFPDLALRMADMG